MSGEKSFCFLTFGQSHELEMVQNIWFCSTLQRATGTLLGRDWVGVAHNIFLQSHIKSEPAETTGKFVHLNVKTGETVELGLKFMTNTLQKKELFHKKIIL